MGAVVVVVGGGGGGWVGGVVVGGGAGAGVVGVTAGAGVLDDPEPCVVGVGGCVVDVRGPPVVGAVGAFGAVRVVGVVGAVGAAGAFAAVGAAFEAGMPLFNAAKKTLPTFCPVACPFVLSPSKRYSGILWNATCQWPWPTFITARPFTPFGPDT